MNDAIFAMLGIPEILLILLVVIFWAAVVGGVVFLVIWLIRRGKSPTPAISPHQPQPDQPKSPPSTCPRCGTALPADSPQGLCPRCVMSVGLATQTEATGEFGPHGTKVIKPPLAPADIGKYFPQLEILDCLGRGGMGVVYKARQPKLNRLVALKILAPEKGADPQFAERFLREAQALARLNHPNIVTVHDFGEADGMFYLLMEYVDGATLRQLLREGRMKPETALTIVPKICEALQFAHEQGVVHRDIKPENVLLDKQGRVKIADFGIARIIADTGRAGSPLPADATQPEAGAHGAPRPAVGLTQDQILGTPHYMAPEQMDHPQTVDHRADIYSLGVVFYEMLTGELPLGKFQPPSRKVQVDVRLDEIVLHALEKEPARRYQHVSQVKSDVETIATTRPTTTGAPSPVNENVLAKARHDIKTPASWLVATGILNWIAIPLFVMLLLPIASPNAVASTPAIVALIAALFLSSAMILAGLKMKRLEAYRLAILGSFLAIFIAPGNIIGLPVGIWCLVTLFRREVRDAFQANSNNSTSASENKSINRLHLAIGGYQLLLTLLCIVWAAIAVKSAIQGQGQWHWGPLLLAVLLIAPTAVFCGLNGWWLLVKSPSSPLQRNGFALTSYVFTALGTLLFLYLLIFETTFNHRLTQNTDPLPSANRLVPPARPIAPAFQPTIQTVLKHPDRRVAELLDLDTGHRATSTSFGENNRETHVWVRANKMDLLGFVEKGRVGVLSHDMAIVPAPSNSWHNLNPSQILTNWALNQQEPQLITAVAAGDNNTDTWFFQTRERTYGVLQILGQNDKPLGVKVRYKLVQNPGALSPQNGKDSKPVIPRANIDQDIPLAQALEECKAIFPDGPSLTEEEVVAAVRAIKIKFPDIPVEAYQMYQRVIKERVLPKGMYFDRIPGWDTDRGTFQVDWRDLTLDYDRAGIKGDKPGTVFNYRIRAQFLGSENETVHKLAPARLRTFGPVIERIVNDDGAGRDFLIDLDTGNLLTPPKDLDPSNTNKFAEWFRESGADAMGETSVSIHGLVGMEMVVRPVVESFWENLSVQHALANDILQHGTPGAPVFLSAKGKLPETFLFRTREGSVGILQITGFTDNPCGVKIRYKRAQSNEARNSKENRSAPSANGDSDLSLKARADEIRQVLLAGLMYADAHQGKWATDISELRPYLSQSLAKSASNSFEYRPPGSTGAATNHNVSLPRQTAVVFEKTPVSPEGQWVGFADGHVEFIKEAARLQNLRAMPMAHERAESSVTPPAVRRLPTGEFSQEFQMTFPLTPNGRFSLDNGNGSIEITGWDRNEVLVKGVKHGKNEEVVKVTKIDVDSKADNVNVYARLPRNVRGGNENVTVDYTIKVPRTARLEKIKNGVGNVTVENVSGDIAASTSYGSMGVTGSGGSLDLSTTIGQITAEPVSIGSGQFIRLKVTEGAITATLPANANAAVTAIAFKITNEFSELPVKTNFPGITAAQFTLGKGSATVEASVIKGNVTIRRGK